MASLAQRSVFVASAITLLGLSISCKNNTTIPTATLSTETKTGTVAVGGTDTQKFTVNYTYDYTQASVQLTKLTSVATGANVTTPIGVVFGSINTFDGTCVRSTYSANAVIPDSEHVTDAVFIGPNNYCIQVYDNATLTEAVNYTITVRHY